MRIGTNIAAYMAESQLSGVENKLSKSLNRLSSGYKINNSKDDPAGMAVAQKLRVQVKELDRAGMNAQNGISVVDTAEGVMSEVESILQRMRELAVQGASDTYTDEDRKNIMSEISQLRDEIDRISKDTQYNNRNLLDGTFDRKSYAYDANGRMTGGVSVLYASGKVPVGEYTLKINGGKIDATDATIQAAFGTDAIAVADGNKVTIKKNNGFELDIALNDSTMSDQTVKISVTDLGGLPIQVGNNEGQIINVIIPKMSSANLHVDDVDYTTAEGCSMAISKLDTAISYVSRARGNLGAYQNRLDSTSLSISGTNENLTRALSTLADTDMAYEMSEYTSKNVLQQAGISMLTQANQMPEKILQLLQ